MIFDRFAPRILAIVKEALQRNQEQQKLPGNPKLHQLQKQLIEHAGKITVSTTPVAVASNADVNALHAVIAAQSEKIERMSAQIDELTAMMKILLAQPPQANQSAASGPRLFGVV